MGSFDMQAISRISNNKLDSRMLENNESGEEDEDNNSERS